MISKFLAFSFEFQSLEQFFLTVCQNNFGNKIPFLNIVYDFGPKCKAKPCVMIHDDCCHEKNICLTACIGVLECRLKWVQSLNFRFDIQNMNFRLAIQVLNFLGWLLKINYVQLQPMIKNATYFVIILLKTIIDRVTKNLVRSEKIKSSLLKLSKR